MEHLRRVGSFIMRHYQCVDGSEGQGLRVGPDCHYFLQVTPGMENPKACVTAEFGSPRRMAGLARAFVHSAGFTSADIRRTCLGIGILAPCPIHCSTNQLVRQYRQLAADNTRRDTKRPRSAGVK
jgi:hypothetical protein